ncbi:unnamed protein product [Orchesella dallaii]|uniref:Uncharacterized protein n=1 Tax=Orchesella dallaii TaxID=48710 RepID=A0ABP1RAQ9_9HEXA
MPENYDPDITNQIDDMARREIDEELHANAVGAIVGSLLARDRGIEVEPEQKFRYAFPLAESICRWAKLWLYDATGAAQNNSIPSPLQTDNRFERMFQLGNGRFLIDQLEQANELLEEEPELFASIIPVEFQNALEIAFGTVFPDMTIDHPIVLERLQFPMELEQPNENHDGH